ncbi:hypothetical protein AB7M31_005345 [Pseudomonas sp. IAP-CY TE4608]
MEITLNKKGQKSQCFQSNEIPFPASPMLARRGTKKPASLQAFISLARRQESNQHKNY